MTDSEMKETEARIILAAQVKFWMNRFNKDVKALAEESGISIPMIYKLMRGDNAASVDTIARLANAFEIQPSVLLTPIPQDKDG